MLIEADESEKCVMRKRARIGADGLAAWWSRARDGNYFGILINSSQGSRLSQPSATGVISSTITDEV